MAEELNVVTNPEEGNVLQPRLMGISLLLGAIVGYIKSKVFK